MNANYKVSVALEGVIDPIVVDMDFDIDLKRNTYEAQVDAAISKLTEAIRKPFVDSVGALAFILNPFDED